MKPRYWDSDGRYQAAADLLREKVPMSGSVDNPRKNKKLERYRKATNCYYDLYNNGLCNRAREFASLFKIASSRYYNGFDFSENFYDLVEERMDAIIVEAAAEQGIAIEEEVASETQNQ
jgi:hypothetical protein